MKEGSGQNIFLFLSLIPKIFKLCSNYKKRTPLALQCGCMYFKGIYSHVEVQERRILQMGEEEMPGLCQLGAEEDQWHGKNRYQIQIHPQSKVEWWNLAIMPILPEMLTAKSYPAIQQLATNLSPPSKRVKNYEMLNPLQQFRTGKISIQLKMLQGLPGTRPIKPKMTKDQLRGGYIFSQGIFPTIHS